MGLTESTVGTGYSYTRYKHCRETDSLHCKALKQAVWILQLQRLLVLHGAKPPGVVNDAAEPHTWREQGGEDRTLFITIITFR